MATDKYTPPKPKKLEDAGLDLSKYVVSKTVKAIKLRQNLTLYSLPAFPKRNEKSKKITVVKNCTKLFLYKATYKNYWIYIINAGPEKASGWVKIYNEEAEVWLADRISSITKINKNVSKKDAEIFKKELYKQTQDNYNKSKKLKNGRIKVNLPIQNPTKSKRLAHFLRSQGIIIDDSNDKLRHTHFNRFSFLDPYITIGGSKEYLFFTKPDLNLVASKNSLNSDIKTIPYFSNIFKRYPQIIHQLQFSSSSSNNPFMPLLTNSVASSLDLPSISNELVETAVNIYGTSISYRGLSNKSSENVDFSLDFRDGIDLEVYNLFKTWDMYNELKCKGLISGPPGSKTKNSSNDYRNYKILHDQIAIYKFIVADDLETIIYYACFYGCFPKSTPRESFSDVSNGYMTYSVEWHSQFVYDLDPLILRDFNIISYNHWKDKYKKDGVMPIWNNRYNEINGGFRKCPLIVEEWDGTSKMYRPKLKWV